MYSKVYNISCDPSQADALMAHYDESVTPAIRDSAHHVGHLMVETGENQWILVSNYHSADAAEAAGDMVGRLVSDMGERFGMKLDIIGEGEARREVS